MLALLAAAGVSIVLVAGIAAVGLFRAVVTDSSSPTGTSTEVRATPEPATALDPETARDELSNRPMLSVDASAARPGPVSTLDPGPAIVLPAPTTLGPASVPSGFPATPEGALAQLAAINQVAFESGSLSGAREVIRAWALPGGPSTTSWSVVHAMATLFDSAGVSGGGSARLAIVLTPLMGLIKGTVGTDFVVPCVDFELDVTLDQTARGAVADCQRMVWSTDRWLIGPGAEPAQPPSVWPDTDLAISVGYRDLDRG
ncbi:hypothetical protein SAMN05660324_1951 [Klenkia brasiliensis]|uniref:Uncharacterized protein n=1 Tax=Klenkia brasiliensis TaxID=333142 RepID=A0A1G7SBH1_9ACTN|nr:hypothetical protein SAMN05660324_1951 [Klenkia brasiliensis]